MRARSAFVKIMVDKKIYLSKPWLFKYKIKTGLERLEYRSSFGKAQMQWSIWRPPYATRFLLRQSCLSSVSLRADRSVCVIESNCSLDICGLLDWDRSGPLLLPGPMRGLSRRFPRTALSQFRVPLLSRPFARVTEIDFWFCDSIAWKAELRALAFLIGNTITRIVFVGKTDFWVVRRMLE